MIIHSKLARNTQIKEKKKEKRKLMAWIEVYGGQRSLAFELTAAILYYKWKYIVNVRLVPWQLWTIVSN